MGPPRADTAQEGRRIRPASGTREGSALTASRFLCWRVVAQRGPSPQPGMISRERPRADPVFVPFQCLGVRFAPRLELNESCRSRGLPRPWQHVEAHLGLACPVQGLFGAWSLASQNTGRASPLTFELELLC